MIITILHIYCNNCINISFYCPFQDVNIHSYVFNMMVISYLIISIEFHFDGSTNNIILAPSFKYYKHLFKNT